MSKMLLQSIFAASRQVVKRQFLIPRVVYHALETKHHPWKAKGFGGRPRYFHNAVTVAHAAGIPTPGANEKQRNNSIVSLAKAQDWKGIIDVYWKEKESFNIINMTTMFDQLKNIKGLDPDEEQVVAFYTDADEWIRQQGQNSFSPKRIHIIRKAIESMNAAKHFSGALVQPVPSTAVAAPTTREDSECARKVSIQINDRIIALGEEEQDWKAILHIYVTEKSSFDTINYSTAMVQLGGIARLDKEDSRLQELVHDICVKLQESTYAWTPRILINVTHSLAKIGLKSKDAMSIFHLVLSDDFVSRLIEEAKCQDTKDSIRNLALLAWSSATLEIESRTFFALLDQEASHLIQNSRTAQDASIMVWASAKLDYDSPELFGAVESRLEWLFDHGSPQAVSNIVWTFGHFRFHSDALFDCIDNRGHAIFQPTNDNMAQHASIMTLSVATLGNHPFKFIESLLLHIPDIIESGSVQHICILCYSFSLLDLVHKSEFQLLWSRALEIPLESMGDEGQKQLLMTYIYALAAGVERLEPPKQLLEQAATLQMIETTESRSHREISKLLHGMGFIHEVEVPPFPNLVPGMMSIDIASKEHMIAIEFDGPSHFLHEVGSGKTLEIENGQTKAKRLFLERLGWKVVNIRYFEWARTKTPGEKLRVLRRALKRVGHKL